MANRLAQEKSPYLLQHADNPVEWYAWSDDALERARREDKPLLVSIGYSACHWCHVMERESFEDEETARLMNDLFVNVKVDREERPDVDSIYMEAVQAMTGQGGWPLNVFLTPDGRPFFGGTYFPPSPRHGMPAWPQVLQAVAQAYRERRGDVLRTAASLTQAIQESQQLRPSQDLLSPDLLRLAYARAAAQFDLANGGFGGAPKFPQPLSLEFVLRSHARLDDADALHFVELTLQRMADGGIFDQLGGGFHRYTVDDRWVVPHFEKMLYDNALLVLVYTQAYQVTGNERYSRVVERTLDYVLRDMRSPQGGFYSAQDADSEGEEGKYYVWTPRDLRDALPERDADVVALRFGVTDRGNFEGKTILTVAMEPDEIAPRVGLPATEVEQILQSATARLLEVRSRRVEPGKDTKILVSWNALMIRALAEAGQTLARPDYLQAAAAAVEFLYGNMRPGGAWVRSYRDGASSIPAFLEDYAFLLEALLSLYETAAHPLFLQRAEDLVGDMVQRFWDDTQGGFFDTPGDAGALVVRPRGFFDNPIPSGNSAASLGLLRLGALTGQEEYTTWALPALRAMRDVFARAPLGFGHLLCALDFYLSTPQQIGIVGVGDPEGTDRLIRVVYDRYLPNRVLAVGREARDLGVTPLLAGREQIGGKATAYVCEHFACRLPVTDPAALAGQLKGTTQRP